MPERALESIDRELAALESAIAGRDDDALVDMLEPAIALVTRMLRAQLEAEGRPAPAERADILDLWRALVKGEPSWNAIRDNCRELVFYRNCLAAGRADALPPAPHRMAVRTARHILLYLRSRARQ